MKKITMNTQPRYQGKPFLRLLECYALDAIGCLQATDRVSLDTVSPKLRDVYQCQGSWERIVEHVMRFSPDISDRIRDAWALSQSYAAAQGAVPSPEDFAQAFADKIRVSSSPTGTEGSIG